MVFFLFPEIISLQISHSSILGKFPLKFPSAIPHADIFFVTHNLLLLMLKFSTIRSWKENIPHWYNCGSNFW